jgi:hypothetical protein
MKNNYQYKYFHNSESDHINIILPGASAGLESDFIEKVFNNSQNANHSTLSVSYPFQAIDKIEI